MIWGSATPYRLGMVSHYTLLHNPFDPGSPRHAMFDSGTVNIVSLRADRIA